MSVNSTTRIELPKTIVLLHEWQEDADESKKPIPQIEYQAEYVVKFSEKKEQEGKIYRG